MLTKVYEAAVAVERIVRLRHRDLVRQHDASEIAEDRSQMHQPAKTTEGAGRGAHQRDDLARHVAGGV